MKKYNLTEWSIAPYYPYTTFRQKNTETDILNTAILPPIPATVPGSIYKTLEKAGIIEDPYFEMNSLKAQWVSNHWWYYDTVIELHPNGNRIELVADGRFIDIELQGDDGKNTYQNKIRLPVKQENGLCSDEGLKGFY